MTYVCPMHPEVTSDKPGRCPKCGMKLVSSIKNNVLSHGEENSYRPLVVIIGLILVVVAALSYRDLLVGIFNLRQTIEYFMIGFFLVFSGFKLLDLEGFAQGYSTYDLLAQKVFTYGYVYPFIELLFALAMIVGWQTNFILIAEVVVMGFSGIGVLIKVLKKEKFQCACLGTIFKLPLTSVTLVEDFGMALLAVLLLIS